MNLCVGVGIRLLFVRRPCVTLHSIRFGQLSANMVPELRGVVDHMLVVAADLESAGLQRGESARHGAGLDGEIVHVDECWQVAVGR